MDVQSAVTLTGTSIFNDNYVNGLLISTYGAVTLGSVSASNNGLGAGNGNGLDVANAAGTLARPVTLNGNYFLNGNEDQGLYLYSKGAVRSTT